MLELMCVFTLMLLCERFIFAIVCLLCHFLGCGSDKRSVWFVSTVIQSTMNLATGIMSALSRLITFSLRGLVWCVLMMMFWGMLYVAAHHAPAAMVSFQRVYNSNMGGLIRYVLVVPANSMLLLWDALIPIWNLFVYCVKTIPVRVLLENVLQNVSDFESSILELAYAVETLMTSLFTYITTWMFPPDSFDAGLRILDLMTPLGHMRLCVSYILAWFGKMCAIGLPPLDWIMYPFLDINFGEAVHYLVNAFLFLVMHVPAITIDRCQAGGSQLMYCLPDFEPVFDLTVRGVRNFGFGIDNWLDVTLLIVQAALVGTNPVCTGWSVVDFHTGDGQDTLMGINETRVIGISAYEFVKTDGRNMELYTRTTVQQFPNAFPFDVRLDFGLALVTASQDAKGVMGCKCTDESFGMQIVCAVASLHDGESGFLVPVEFRIPTTSFYMGCSKSKIKLESIRWPVSRYTAPGVKSSASPIAEAAIWVRPFCSSEWIDIACIDTFSLAGCFPYCMGLWTKGYTGSVVLRDADEWATSVSMMNRDCGLHTWDVRSGALAEATAKLRNNSGVTNAWMNNNEIQTGSSHCIYSGATLSRMVKTSVPAYSVYRSVDLTNQPFAFAGDLAFTAVQTSSANTWGVKVSRIWGNQVCDMIVRLKCCTSSSVSGAHCEASSMHFRICSSGSCARCRSMSSAALSIASLRSMVLTSSVVAVVGMVWAFCGLGASRFSKKEARTSAMAQRFGRETVRLGSMRRRCIASLKLISFRGFFLLADCRSVNREAVSDLDPMRARVCDAFLRSRPVMIVNRSSANIRPSSVTRTGANLEFTDSKGMVSIGVLWKRVFALVRKVGSVFFTLMGLFSGE